MSGILAFTDCLALAHHVGEVLVNLSAEQAGSLCQVIFLSAAVALYCGGKCS